MNNISNRELVRAGVAGYVLWVAAYIILTMMLVGKSPLDLLPMPASIFFFCLGAFVILAFVALFFLFFYYRIVGCVCREATRMQGELVYVLSSGLISTLLFILMSQSWTWGGLAVSWVFFSLPSLFTVLALRGQEWYGRQKAGQR